MKGVAEKTKTKKPKEKTQKKQNKRSRTALVYIKERLADFACLFCVFS
jgi:hypothetical protein